MKIFSKYVFPAASAAIFSIALAACSADEPDTPVFPEEPATPQEEVSNSPICILIGGTDWNVDAPENDDVTRAMPPGTGNNQQTEKPVDGSAETALIDKVRIVTFRRVDPEEYKGDGDKESYYEQQPFVYDSSNDKILPVLEGTDLPDADLFPSHDAEPGHTPHRYASDKEGIRKVKGFEYRIVAIAYSDDAKSASSFKDINLSSSASFAFPDGDSGKFSLNLHDGLTFEDFQASLTHTHIERSNDSWRDFFAGQTSGIAGAANGAHLGSNIVETPQLFFGECYTSLGGTTNKVIKYSENDADGELTSSLPIGGILYRGVAKLELNIEVYEYNPSWLLHYSSEWIAIMADQVPAGVGLTSYDRFLRPEAPAQPDKYVPIYHTKVDARQNSPRTIKIETYILPCATRLAFRIKHSDGSVRNGQLYAKDTETSGNGTGIISPDSHEGIYYFRRNHKYVINVKNTENIIDKYSFK
ncbi:MAG: hypothetical protein HDR48_03365 [Bacteroides sp.]|nr:hypothetical protein [Bacteroides sp.]